MVEPLPDTLGRIGSLHVRLARTDEDLQAVQELRYKVFFEELSAIPSAKEALEKRDSDRFDTLCDHLLVVDEKDDAQIIVGTYRLLRQNIAEVHGGFYTQNEFDVAPLITSHKDKVFLELGRSCVLPAYRTKRSVELLWQGIWAYVLHHKIDVMFGCASLQIGGEQEVLNFLASLNPPPQEWQVKAHPKNRIISEKGEQSLSKQALAALPPLIKGYLRLGAYIGSEAVIDHAFGTTDVLVVLPVSVINPRYINHYGAAADRYT